MNASHFRFLGLGLALALAPSLASSCRTAPSSETARDELHARVQDTIAELQRDDPGLERMFDDSLAYAVFPNVGKGAYIVGAAYGRGELYEGGDLVGHCSLSQGTVGAQIGGQSYAEVIFFNERKPLDDFKRGAFEFSGQVSAVAIEAGKSADVDYQNGVAIVTRANGGLMAEASVGAQKFSFDPLR